MLPPALLLGQLERRLPLLTSGAANTLPHHHTLSATIAWSEELLTDPERRLFHSLAACADGATLELAAAASGQDGMTLIDGLDALIRHSPFVALRETLRPSRASPC